eukprot:jgi/Botrbrau1/2485/Bobra.0226s0042.1
MGDLCCLGTELGRRWSLKPLENRIEEEHDKFTINMLLKGIRSLSADAHESAASRTIQTSANRTGLKAGVNSLFEGVTDSDAVYLTLYAVMDGTLGLYNVGVGNLLSSEARGQGLVRTSGRLLSRVSLQGFKLSSEPACRVPQVGIHHSRHAFKTAGATKVISVPIPASRSESTENVSKWERPLGFLTIGWHHLPSHLEARVIDRMQKLTAVVAEDFVAAHEQIVLHMEFFLPPASINENSHALDHHHEFPSPTTIQDLTERGCGRRRFKYHPLAAMAGTLLQHQLFLRIPVSFQTSSHRQTPCRARKQTTCRARKQTTCRARKQTTCRARSQIICCAKRARASSRGRDQY